MDGNIQVRLNNRINNTKNEITINFAVNEMLLFKPIIMIEFVFSKLYVQYNIIKEVSWIF